MFPPSLFLTAVALMAALVLCFVLRAGAVPLSGSQSTKHQRLHVAIHTSLVALVPVQGGID